MRLSASGRRSDDPPRAVPLWLLGLFTFCGTLGMHIFVPALPAAAQDLHATPAALELTISLYILGLAVGQLVYGPASDRFGRRPTLLVGLSIFTIAASPRCSRRIPIRSFWRAFSRQSGDVRGWSSPAPSSATRRRRMRPRGALRSQSAGDRGPCSCAADRFRPQRLLGLANDFGGLAALGVANFVLAWRILPETRPEALFVSASRYARDYVGLLRSRQFLGYAIGGGCATTSLYAFVACAPFIFVDRLHVPSASVGLYLALLVSGLWLGSLLQAS